MQLSSLFKEAEFDFKRIEDGSISPQSSEYASLVRSVIQKWTDCSVLISKFNLFSFNEDLEDIPTLNLKYILVPYYLSLSLQKDSDMDKRLMLLDVSKQLIVKFLNFCVDLELITKQELENNLNQSKLSSGQLRNNKIERLTQKKKLEFQLNFIEKRYSNSNLEDCCEEEDQRNYYILTIQLCAKNSFDELNLIEQEIEILKHKNTLKCNTDLKHDARMNTREVRPECNNKFPECFMIDERFKIQKMVFKPHWTQPTMSLEEFGELEYRDLMKRQSENKKVPAKEDTSDDSDIELKKAREWDDWKEDHPKGSGNTGNRGYAY